MSKTLCIVESPAKAKKIGAMLGGNFTVKASVGHIRDLPRKELGVDLNSLKPTYVVSDDKKQVVSGLKRFLKDHDRILLATDPDREGEAIAWHLKVALGLSEGRYQRIVYQEVTEAGIRRALDNPREIDMSTVAAQESRRVLDRLIGYLVSPALSEKAGKRLSAGRVQSVAVRMVVERENAITNFQPVPYQAITLSLQEDKSVKGALIVKPWASDEKHVTDRNVANALLGPQNVRLIANEKRDMPVKHREPLTTVTMQAAAGSLFGLSAQSTMKAAQALFEQGAITYHRTDNPNVSEEGFEKAVAQLQSEGLATTNKRPQFKSKADAQEAHEAIRPTNFSKKEAGESAEQRQVYSIIRERALLLGMPEGTDSVTNMLFRTHKSFSNINGKAQQADYLAKGKVIKSPGWRAGVRIEPFSTTDTLLPNIPLNTDHQGLVSAEQKATKPPGRFTEHTLTKALESAGIGRPSTYAAILENIKNRNYVSFGKAPGKGKKKASPPLIPTDLGHYIVGALGKLKFMNYNYTREVERSLDKIAEGKMGYPALVGPVLKQIQDDIEQKLDGQSLIRESECPQCSQRVIQKDGKRNSKFWVHAERSHGEQCIQYLKDQNDQPVIPPPETESSCPSCGEPIVRREKKGNKFWVHRNKEQKDQCGITFINDKDGSPELPEKPKASLCIECGDTITRKYSGKTKKHFWIHAKKKPSCGNFFLDDSEGEPLFTEKT